MDPGVIERAEAVAIDGGVSLSINLTGGVYVNQSAAFSDYHATGANPAASASFTDEAFVTPRFHVDPVAPAPAARGAGGRFGSMTRRTTTGATSTTATGPATKAAAAKPAIKVGHDTGQGGRGCGEAVGGSREGRDDGDRGRVDEP